MPIPITSSASAASARTAGSVAASSPEMMSRRGFASTGLAVAGRAPGVGDAAAVRRARQVVDVACGLDVAARRVVGDERVDGAVGRVVGDRRAGAARGLEPEVDDGRALDDRLVAEDGDRLRVAERRERRAVARRARRASPRAARRRSRRGPGAAASRARRPPRPTRRRRARSPSSAPPRAQQLARRSSSASSHESASKRRGPALRERRA